MTKFKKITGIALAGCMALSSLMMTAGAVAVSTKAADPAVTATTRVIQPRDAVWIDKLTYNSSSAYDKSFSTSTENGNTLALYFENQFSDSTALNVEVTWTGSETKSWNYEITAAQRTTKTISVPSGSGKFRVYITPLRDGQNMHFYMHSRQY